jgi:alpha-glucosidase
MSVAAERGVAGSTLEMYRHALGVRREHGAFGDGPLEWLLHTSDLLAVRRTASDGSAAIAAINLSTEPARLPAEWGTDVLAASGDDVAVLAVGDSADVLALGGETAVWLRV